MLRSCFGGLKFFSGISCFQSTLRFQHATSSENKLLRQIQEPVETSKNKVSVIGAGQVGMACAFSILSQIIANEIALIDVDKNRVHGELMDLQHGVSFLDGFNGKISAGTDFSVTAGSKICIVTAGARQRTGESRSDLVQRNAELFKKIIPEIVHYSPEVILLIVTNPVDVLTWIAWKISKLPQQRVIGSGTNLDSSRFRFLLSRRFNIAPTATHGWIIGEHGDHSVPVWSGVNMAGVRLLDLNPAAGTKDDHEKWHLIHEQVVASAYDIIKLKGYTSWAIGLSCAAVAKSILLNSRTVSAVSTYAKGFYDIEEDIFMSLPCVLGEDGVTDIVNFPLSDPEMKKLQKSAAVIHKIQKDVHF